MSENIPSSAQIPRSRPTEVFWSGVYNVVAGDSVRIRDAAGDWHQAIADSGVERGHRFPILWVNTVGRNGQPCRLPWPIEAVVAPTETTQ